MARSLKKGFYVNEKILHKVVKMNASGDKKIIKVRDRACQIVPEMVGFTFAVHNGKQFVSVYVTEDMLGHRLGEFVLTRTFKGHPF
ncbi:MAG: 30S ribosomal protein S19 [Candidatus Peribacteria bacterium]|jgi:small subunit ribosomal protein S19|nr:30S ribosomal protein S19 [Candidatus Peribacteria bacterium]